MTTIYTEPEHSASEVWIQTYTGKKFYPFNPKPEDINIQDIAHALSMKCRFTGHCRNFYSVAEHSYYVSVLCEKKHAFYGLLHDAAEAYLPDVARPLKDYINGFRQIEDNILAVIYNKYGLKDIFPSEIKEVDTRLCITEGRDLMPDISDWKIKAKPYDLKIRGFLPSDARSLFLSKFYELHKKMEKINEMPKV
jgi:hypothetical protein